MKADYAKRGYHYVKNYGLSKLYLKAKERLERDILERDYQQWMISERPADSCSGSIILHMHQGSVW